MRNAFFLNITNEEKQSIQDRHRSLYDGYATNGDTAPKMNQLKVENLALDEKGITVSNTGEVKHHTDKEVNRKLKKVCDECNGLYEGEMCECGNGGMYEDVPRKMSPTAHSMLVTPSPPPPPEPPVKLEVISNGCARVPCWLEYEFSDCAELNARSMSRQIRQPAGRLLNLADRSMVPERIG